FFQIPKKKPQQKALDHSPEQLQVRVGDHVFTPSLTDLASAIPPHESTLGYVLVNGGPAGRNDLSLKNDFTFVLTRRDASSESASPDAKDVEPTPIPQSIRDASSISFAPQPALSLRFFSD